MPVPVLTPFDFNRLELLNARLQNLGVDPSGLAAGDKGLMWIDGAGSVKYWDGTTTKTLGLSTGGDADTLGGQAPAYYLARANATGTQPASTISDFDEAVSDQVGTMVSGNTESGITVVYQDADNTLDFTVTDSPTVAGATPAQLRDRATHTGVQASGTISDFNEAAQDAVGGILADTSTIDFTYNDAGNSISAEVLDSPTVAGATPAQLRDRSTHTGTQLRSTISDFDTGVRTSRLDQMAAPTSAVSFNGQRITSVATPTASTDAANKSYVDAEVLSARQGITAKDAVRAISTSNVTLTAQGSRTVDSVVLASGDRVLLVGQSTASQNGIYTVGGDFSLTRSSDADATGELVPGSQVWVNEGTVNGDSQWTLLNDTTPVMGTTAQTWGQTSGAGQINAGAGLTKAGNTIDVVGTSNRIAVNADNIDIHSGYVGQTSITTLGTVATGTWNATAIAANKGGTGQTAYAVGDILFASSTSALSKLADIATGNVLLSGGVGVAPSYGKVGLTTHVTGTLPVANGGTGATTAAAALAALGGVGKFSANVGNGSLTEITINHNLGTRDVNVEVFRNSTPWDTVIVDVERTDTNNVKLRFAVAPASNAFRAVITG